MNKVSIPVIIKQIVIFLTLHTSFFGFASPQKYEKAVLQFNEKVQRLKKATPPLNEETRQILENENHENFQEVSEQLDHVFSEALILAEEGLSLGEAYLQSYSK